MPLASLPEGQSRSAAPARRPPCLLMSRKAMAIVSPSSPVGGQKSTCRALPLNLEACSLRTPLIPRGWVNNSNCLTIGSCLCLGSGPVKNGSVPEVVDDVPIVTCPGNAQRTIESRGTQENVAGISQINRLRWSRLACGCANGTLPNIQIPAARSLADS